MFKKESIVIAYFSAAIIGGTLGWTLGPSSSVPSHPHETDQFGKNDFDVVNPPPSGAVVFPEPLTSRSTSIPRTIPHRQNSIPAQDTRSTRPITTRPPQPHPVPEPTIVTTKLPPPPDSSPIPPVPPPHPHPTRSQTPNVEDRDNRN